MIRFLPRQLLRPLRLQRHLLCHLLFHLLQTLMISRNDTEYSWYLRKLHGMLRFDSRLQETEREERSRKINKPPNCRPRLSRSKPTCGYKSRPKKRASERRQRPSTKLSCSPRNHCDGPPRRPQPLNGRAWRSSGCKRPSLCAGPSKRPTSCG